MGVCLDSLSSSLFFFYLLFFFFWLAHSTTSNVVDSTPNEKEEQDVHNRHLEVVLTKVRSRGAEDAWRRVHAGFLAFFELFSPLYCVAF